MDDVIVKARRRRSLPTIELRRLIREQAQLSQDEMAQALGVTRSAVSRWENGEREPRGAALDNYATFLEKLKREVLA